jgi:cyclophilin family peptidyl-prolyl cis-trans isomerase
MVQTGGYGADYKSKPLPRPPVPIESESSVKAGLSNVPGTLAMARTGDPNSASSQFFINVANNKRLDFTAPTAQGYGYTVFGKVIEGMDIVNKIAKTPTGAGGPFPTDVPQTPIVINSAKIVEAK